MFTFISTACYLAQYLLKNICWNLIWQGTPSVAVAQQHNEVRARRSPLAALNLAQAYLHGLLIYGCFPAYSPAQIDCLKTRAVPLAEFAQAGEYSLLQGVAFCFQVAEG